MTTTKKPRKQRETPEQKARRVGRGLGFFFMPSTEKHWEKWNVIEGVARYGGMANWHEIALWRALASKMGVRL